jgi:gag-polypeptide of LTR copia-type/Zinc knuckle
MSTGLGSIIVLWRKFTRIQKGEDTPMRTHIANLRNLADKLCALGDAPSDALTIAVLFGSLPAAYHQLIVSLDSSSQAQDLDFVIGRIINEEETINHFSPSSTASNSHLHHALTTKIVDKSHITCFKCGVRGHFQSECPEPGPLREIPTTTPAVRNIAASAVCDPNTQYAF